MTINGQWQVQDAKSKLSAVITAAEKRGPQSITRHGRPVAVVMSAKDFERLVKRPKSSLLEFLATSPLGDLDLDRDRSDLRRDLNL
jgi:prevent-host-death family protein